MNHSTRLKTFQKAGKFIMPLVFAALSATATSAHAQSLDPMFVPAPESTRYSSKCFYMPAGETWLPGGEIWCQQCNEVPILGWVCKVTRIKIDIPE